MKQPVRVAITGAAGQIGYQLCFRIAAGEPIEERIGEPGSDMYEMMMEDIQREYTFRKENPNYGNNA